MILYLRMTVLESKQARRKEVQSARLAVHRGAALEGAGTLFGRVGFEAQMADIAAESGISLKALYEAFASKEDLFVAVIDQHFERYVGPVLAADRQEGSDGAVVAGFLNDLLEAMEADRDYLLLYARGSDGVPAKMREKGRDPYAKYLVQVQQHLISLIERDRASFKNVSPAIGADDLALVITAAVAALARGAATSDPPKPVTAIGPTLHALVAPHLRG